MRDADPKVIAASKLLRDAGETRRARIALRESQERLAREVAGARTLQAISTRLISEVTQESLFAQILDAAMELMSSDASSIQMLAPDGKTLILLGWRNFHPISAEFWRRVTTTGDCSCGRALRSQQRVVISDIDEAIEDPVHLAEYRRSQIRAVQSTPLYSRTGKPLGMISTHWRNPYEPPGCDLRLFDVLARQAADLIERTLAEETLRVSEAKYRSLFESMDEAFYLVEIVRDRDGRPTDVMYLDENAASIRFVGMSVTGKRLGEVNPGAIPEWLPIFDRVAQSGKPERFEKFSTLTHRWQDFHVFPAGSGKDRVGALTSDISSRKLAEENLRESETKYRSLFESMDEAFYLIEIVRDKDGRPEDIIYLDENAAGIRLVGVSVLGRRLGALNPRALTEWLPIFDRVAHSGTSERFERLSDLTRQWQVYQVFPAGSGKDRIGLLSSNITSRKLAEEQLRNSEAKFRAIANMAPVIIWMSDVDSRCVYVNQPWLDFTGQTLEAALAEDGWGQPIHPEDVPNIQAVYQYAHERRENFQMYFRLRRADGDYRWILSSGAPRYDGDGSFAGYVGSSIDVTERRQAEEALATINQRLTDAQEDERARIARELHDDIVQRLAGLGWRLGAACNPPPVSDSAIREIESVRAEVMALARDVQALSHRLHPAWIEVLGIAPAVRALCREISRRSGVEIVCQVEDVPDELLRKNSVCLHRVLQEALQNAVKHSRTKIVEVALRAAGDEIEMTVKDFGVGFDPGTQGHQGLGLTSMKERLRAVGGRLSISSQQDGTTIHAYVPIAQAEADPPK